MANFTGVDGGLRELALFAGAGGGILGGKLLGWRTVCAVEWEPYPASVLCTRQNDGLLPPFPIWDDVQTFDGRPWQGIVDVVSGGFPCQDISAAGKGAGIDGERSGMWREMARIIREVRPRFVFVENSPMLTSRGLGTVLGDLAAMGFDARWGVLGAADVGAPHQRDRIWIVAHSNQSGCQTQRIRQKWSGNGDEVVLCRSQMADATDAGIYERRRPDGIGEDVRLMGGNERNGLQSFGEKEIDALAYAEDKRDVRRDGFLGIAKQEHDKRRSASNGRGEWWNVEPDVGRVADGVAARVDRLKAIGNGQVPAVAATAWRLLND